MISLSEVRKKSRRDNYEKNLRLNFFAARMSIYFTWLFANMGVTPNFVTMLFFLAGVAGAFLILGNNSVLVILSYIIYRIHLILDVSDGELARFTQKFSQNGAYWDFLTHSLVYPLFFANMGIALYMRYHTEDFLILACFGAISISFFDATKNNYYRALFSNRIMRDDYESRVADNTIKKNIFHTVHPSLFEIFSFEGLLAFYVIAYFIGNIYFSKLILIGYVFLFFSMSVLKIYFLSTKNTYPKRN